MKTIKCLTITPEAVCDYLNKSHQPICISGIELNLNELAVSLIDSLMERMAELELALLSASKQEADVSTRQSPKSGRLIASYLISK